MSTNCTTSSNNIKLAGGIIVPTDIGARFESNSSTLLDVTVNAASRNAMVNVQSLKTTEIDCNAIYLDNGKITVKVMYYSNGKLIIGNDVAGTYIEYGTYEGTDLIYNVEGNIVSDGPKYSNVGTEEYTNTFDFMGRFNIRLAGGVIVENKSS